MVSIEKAVKALFSAENQFPFFPIISLASLVSPQTSLKYGRNEKTKEKEEIHKSVKWSSIDEIS